ncbi:MAG: ribosome maturation factor RimP [Cyclobacteriaceae bacterium]
MVEQKNLIEEIQSHIESLIADDTSLFIVDIELKGSFGNQRLVIALDGDEGVSIETCVSVSRQLSAYLEEKDLIEGKYNLEVTSAGVDQPLKSLRQYQKNIGRSLAVKFNDGERMEGELKEVSEVGVSLLIKEKKKEELITVNFEEIDSSKVLVSFK